jgi:hypothetical protein
MNDLKRRLGDWLAKEEASAEKMLAPQASS